MTPNPQTPEAQAARERGYALTKAYIDGAAAAGDAADLPGIRKEIGKVRARYLATGDWEGVWQASGSLDAIREAQDSE